jgi:hypothetical protein
LLDFKNFETPLLMKANIQNLMPETPLSTTASAQSGHQIATMPKGVPDLIRQIFR